MSNKIQHFLLVFDHEAGELAELEPFGSDGEAAIVAYAAREKAYEGRGLIEIVLIGSDSLETIKLTHANYFDGSVSLSEYLVGI